MTDPELPDPEYEASRTSIHEWFKQQVTLSLREVKPGPLSKRIGWGRREPSEKGGK